MASPVPAASAPQMMSDISAPAPAAPSPTLSTQQPSPTVNGTASRASTATSVASPKTNGLGPSPIPSPAPPAAGQDYVSPSTASPLPDSTAPLPASTAPPRRQDSSAPPAQQMQQVGYRWKDPLTVQQAPQAPQVSMLTRPVIMDPPAAGTGRPAPPPSATSGFPSPGREHLQANPKFADDRHRLSAGIAQATPEAVRRTIRDNWEKCLLGSDFHQAFVLNASIHHASAPAIQRGLRDFGKTMIGAARNEIVQHLSKADLDQIADAILAKVSNNFLDKALEIRLRTIEAKPLINALAKAERLGYEPSDILDEDRGRGQEYVAPSAPAPAPYPGAAYSPRSAAAAPAAAPAAPAAPQVLHCQTCLRKFDYASAYHHHVKGPVCTRTPNHGGGFKFSCNWCGQGFTTVVGLQYHNANKVCGDFGEPFKSVQGQQITPSIPTQTPRPVQQTPVSIPATPNVAAGPSPLTIKSRNGTPNLGTPSSIPGGNDPYSHLTQTQMTTMQEELRQAEVVYGERIRQAHLIPNEAEKKARLDGLSNSFGTKQSLIRKKYGVRLRQRRTKVEIQQEKERMGYKSAAELTTEMKSVTNGTAHYAKPAVRGWAPVNGPGSNQVKEEEPDNGDVRMHSAKRQRAESGHGDSPHKRVAVADMNGGLSGSVATAETEDPTSALSTGPDRKPSVSRAGAGTVTEAIALDDEESDDSDSDSDGDIPAQLPASVRQSLQPQYPRPSSSRPGSS